MTLAEKLIPAADLSEQISLAGMEASGTGNMKFAMNGALTIGTDDGANVEIRRFVGNDNFFLFGMLEPEVEALQASGYQPSKLYEEDADLKAAIDLIASGAFSDGDRGTFEPVVSNLLYQDRFMALADYRSYLEAQAEGGEGLRQQGGLDEVGDPQRRPLRLLLLRPVDARLPGSYLGSLARPLSPGAKWGRFLFPPTAPAKGAVWWEKEPSPSYAALGPPRQGRGTETRRSSPWRGLPRAVLLVRTSRFSPTMVTSRMRPRPLRNTVGVGHAVAGA